MSFYACYSEAWSERRRGASAELHASRYSRATGTEVGALCGTSAHATFTDYPAVGWEYAICERCADVARQREAP